MSDSKPVKILCLHGLGQTGDGMLKQLSPLIASLPSHWQFVAPDAPNALPGLKDFDYMGTGKTEQVSSLKSSSSPSPSSSPSSSSQEEKKSQSKSSSLCVQAISIQEAVRYEMQSDSLRPQPWSKGDWNSSMKSYLHSSRPLLDSSADIKRIYDDQRQEQGGEIRDVEKMWSKIEAFSGRKAGKKFPRSWSIQAEGWKGKGEWVGYSISLKLLAKVLDEQGPFDGCIGFSTGGQMAWCLQTLLTHSEAASVGYPTFSPFPKSQPAFSFVLNFSAIEFVEKNTFKLVCSYPPLSSSKTLDSYRGNAKIKGNFDRVSKDSQQRMEMNSCSVWGAKDRSIPIFMMANLALSTAKSAFNLVHPGQHEIYLEEDWKTFFVGWLKAVNGIEGKNLQEVWEKKKPRDNLPLDTGIKKPNKDQEGKAKGEASSQVETKAQDGKGRL